MRYVKDPLFFDLFNIFTGNRAAVFRLPSVHCGTPILTHPSYSTGMQENGFPPARHSDCVCILSQILS